MGSNNAQPGGPSTSGATRVVRLEDRSRGAVVHLVGVSHVLAADAARDVRALLSHHRPDAVVLELCSERAGAAIAAALASSRGTGAGSRGEDDAIDDAGPAGPRPPGVVPRAVSIRGLPADRPLPGASPGDLLAQLRCRPGRLAAPADIDADVRTLMESGLFEEVLVHVSAGEESKGADDIYTDDKSRDDEGNGNGNVEGSNPDGDEPESTVLYCAGGACGDGVAEVIVGASVEFRCALDSSLAVTADVRFSWSEKAQKKLGGDPKDLEADVLRRAALLLLEYDKGRPGGGDDEDGDEKSAPGDGDGDGDGDADEETREGAALRAVLRESARRVCAARGLGAHKASVTVAGAPPESVWATASTDDADDSGGVGFARSSLADAGGAVWVSVETTSERETRERLDASTASAGSGDRSRRGANGGRGAPGGGRGPPGLLARIASVASAAATEGTAPRAARAYFAASEIAQEMLAWRVLSATRHRGGAEGAEDAEGAGEEGTPEGGTRVEDAVVRGAGDEAVAALALALEAGVERVVLGDARASATTAAIADAIRRRPGWFPGARLAASTVAAAARLVAFSSPDQLRETISSGLNGGLNGGGSNGTLADVAVADWLRDAVVDARDDRMFDVIRDAAGYERRWNASDGPPPAAFTRSTETPPGLGEGCACYSYEAECEDSVRAAGRSTGGSTGGLGKTVVAVVGAAHVDGIVRRWNASTNEPGDDVSAPRGRS